MIPHSVTARELADLFGISQQRVSVMVGEGTLVRSGRSAYPLAENVQRYTAHLREVASGRGGEDEIANLTAERARLAREQADGHALKNAIARGELIPAADVSARWEDVARRVRGRMLAVPSRVRARLPHLALADVETVDREVRDALGDIADGAA